MSGLRVNDGLTAIALQGWHKELIAQDAKLALFNVPVGSVAFTGDGNNLTMTSDWVTGTRVRIDAIGAPTGTLAPLALNTDYWLIRISGTSYRVTESYAEAFTGATFPMPTIGAGYQFRATKPDRFNGAELIKWEVNHPAYTARYSIAALNSIPPVFSSGEASLNIFNQEIPNNSGVPLVFNCVAIWVNGVATPGSVQGSGVSPGLLEKNVAGIISLDPVTIAPNTSRRITYPIATQYDL